MQSLYHVAAGVTFTLLVVTQKTFLQLKLPQLNALHAQPYSQDSYHF
jgi:hypothetical protein